jgi:hypothetical protein
LASTPLTLTDLPSRFAWAPRISVTTSTPGVFRTAAAALFVSWFWPAVMA